MENTTYVAIARMNALERQMDVVANNMANVDTPAFKSEDTLFTKYLVQVPTNDRLLYDKVSFPLDLGQVRDLTEGHFEATNNPLDLAVHGDGYFVVETASGEQRYTRAGHFRLDQEGKMVTVDGDPVMSVDNQPFFFAPNEAVIDIAKDGTVSTENGVIGQIRLVTFDNEQNLKKTKGGLFQTDDPAIDVATPNIEQGMMERSNVQPVLEMTKLIHIQRAYQRTAKMVELDSDRQRRAISTIAALSQ